MEMTPAAMMKRVNRAYSPTRANAYVESVPSPVENEHGTMVSVPGLAVIMRGKIKRPSEDISEDSDSPVGGNSMSEENSSEDSPDDRNEPAAVEDPPHATEDARTPEPESETESEPESYSMSVDSEDDRSMEPNSDDDGFIASDSETSDSDQSFAASEDEDEDDEDEDEGDPEEDEDAPEDEDDEDEEGSDIDISEQMPREVSPLPSAGRPRRAASERAMGVIDMERLQMAAIERNHPDRDPREVLRELEFRDCAEDVSGDEDAIEEREVREAAESRRKQKEQNRMQLRLERTIEANKKDDYEFMTHFFPRIVEDIQAMRAEGTIWPVGKGHPMLERAAAYGFMDANEFSEAVGDNFAAYLLYFVHGMMTVLLEQNRTVTEEGTTWDYFSREYPEHMLFGATRMCAAARIARMHIQPRIDTWFRETTTAMIAMDTPPPEHGHLAPCRRAFALLCDKMYQAPDFILDTKALMRNDDVKANEREHVNMRCPLSGGKVESCGRGTERSVWISMPCMEISDEERALVARMQHAGFAIFLSAPIAEVGYPAGEATLTYMLSDEVPVWYSRVCLTALQLVQVLLCVRFSYARARRAGNNSFRRPQTLNEDFLKTIEGEFYRAREREPTVLRMTGQLLAALRCLSYASGVEVKTNETFGVGFMNGAPVPGGSDRVPAH